MKPCRGFSLIEMLVVVAIAGIALSIAVPNLQSSIISSRSRGVAESIQGGLMLARSEAIRRNAPVRFQLVALNESLASETAKWNSCTLSAASRFWVVSQYTGQTTPPNTRGVPTGACGLNPYSPPDQEEPCPVAPAYSGTAAQCIADPFLIARSAADRVANIDVTASGTVGTPPKLVVTFGPLGQLLTNLEGAVPAGNPAYRVMVTPAAGNAGRAYTVQVNANGNIRLCDPLATAGSPNACL